MKEIKLIVSDIDGTILDDQHQISSQLKQLLPDLTKHGIHFVLASARSPQGMAAIATTLTLADQPLACYNGALILNHAHLELSETLFSQPLDQLEAIRVFQEIQRYFSSISLNLYSGINWFVPAFDHWVKAESEITQIQPTVADLSDLLHARHVPVHKFLLIDQANTIQSLIAHLNKLSLHHTAYYLSKNNYLEITHRDISKATVVTELAKYYDLQKDQVLAIGDNYNDLPMLQAAGIGIAMANAPIAVQQAATDVTTSNQEEGVIRAIKKYVHY